jgi:hypothetical protein
MEAVSSSETSVDFQPTTQCYITEDNTLHNHRCENLKSCKKHSLMESRCWVVKIFASNSEYTGSILDM